MVLVTNNSLASPKSIYGLRSSKGEGESPISLKSPTSLKSLKSQNLLVGIILILLSYSAWARGGTTADSQILLPWLSVFMLVVLSINSYRLSQECDKVKWLRYFLKDIFTDPIIISGTCFLLLLLVQWLNAGRELVFDDVKYRWTYSLPHVSFLPSAVGKEDAAEMLRWFFPAWAILVVMRSGVITGEGIKIILRGIIINAAFLALFGIFQYATGTQSIFWVIPLKGYFFASFGYPNHAGEFFTLVLSVALGFLANRCFRSYKKKEFDKRIIGLIVISILLLAGANLSLSVAGIIFSWFLAVFAVVYGVWYVWKDIRPSVRINLVAACLAVLCIGYFIAAGVGKGNFSEAVTQMKRKTTEREVGVRFPQIEAAIHIWQDNKLFGVGGWGYRYFLPLYTDDDTWQQLQVGGSANVHNDPVQFLTEFGLFGFLMMSYVVGVLVWQIWRLGIYIIRKPRILYPIIGLLITFIHSFFDLPFRSPAILYHWLFILIAIPYLNIRQRG